MRPVLAGRDVIGRSRTGTGKTLAFGIPSLIRIVEEAKASGEAEVMRDGKTILVQLSGCLYRH